MLLYEQREAQVRPTTPPAKQSSRGDYTVASALNGEPMADRTWNAIEARLWDEYHLSKPTRAILAHVISLCPNPYGIYDPTPMGRILDWWDGIFTREAIAAAFEQMEEHGIGRSFRQGKCWWLVKKFRRENGNFKSQKAWDGLAAVLERYPEIELEFKKAHGYLVPVGAIPSMTTSDTNSDLVSRKKHTSDSDSDSDSEIKPKKTLSVAALALVPLVERCRAMIEESATERGLGETPANPTSKCAVALEQLIRINKMPEQDIEPTLAWALQDSFWQSLILSIPNWRKKGDNGRAKMCNCWSSWRKASGQVDTAKKPISHGRGGTDWSKRGPQTSAIVGGD